jgi:hypothetical protein
MSELVHWCDRIRRSLPVAALLGAIGITATASAQFGQAAGFSEIMSPYFLRRDLVHFVEGLDLDEGQSVILESLFWDYEDANEASKQVMIDRFQEMREQFQTLDRDRIMQIIFVPFEDRYAEWDAFNEQFLQSVRAILNNEQLQRWPEFRRKLRREKQLPQGRLTGESLDLFHVVTELDLEEPTRFLIEPLLREYGENLDEALGRRQELLRESGLMIMHSIRDDQPEAALTVYQDQVDARLGVRKVNDDFIIAIAGALPEEIGREFRRTALERAYPRVYRPTPAERVFEAAKELEGLDEETLKAIRNLEEAFLGELALINEKLVRLIREYEPQEEQYRAAVFALRGTGQQPERPTDPTRQEFRQREQLGRDYVERLRALLTDEQFRSLPGVSRFLNERTSHGRLEPDRRFSSGTTRGAKSEGPKPGAGFSNSGAGKKKTPVGPR